MNNYLPSIQEQLSEMSEQSLLFKSIKKEMVKRGHWKNKDRGSKPPKKHQFTRVSTYQPGIQQVEWYDDSQFIE